MSDDEIRGAVLSTFKARNGVDWARYPHIAEDEVKSLTHHVQMLAQAGYDIVKQGDY